MVTILKVGEPMTSAAGRAKLAQELRDLAERFDYARAVASDAAKVLQSDADLSAANQAKWAKMRKPIPDPE